MNTVLAASGITLIVAALLYLAWVIRARRAATAALEWMRSVEVE